MNKVTSCLWLAGAMSIAMTVPAHAYLDPGTGSIVLQAIIGGVAAGLFVARGYFYRVKAWLGLSNRSGSESAEGMKLPEVDPGRFAIPADGVFTHQGRILRAVLAGHVRRRSRARESAGIYTGWLMPAYCCRPPAVEPATVPGTRRGTLHVLEHQRIPFISYPYEWSFAFTCRRLASTSIFIWRRCATVSP